MTTLLRHPAQAPVQAPGSGARNLDRLQVQLHVPLHIHTQPHVHERHFTLALVDLGLAGTAAAVDDGLAAGGPGARLTSTGRSSVVSPSGSTTAQTAPASPRPPLWAGGPPDGWAGPVGEESPASQARARNSRAAGDVGGGDDDRVKTSRPYIVTGSPRGARTIAAASGSCQTLNSAAGGRVADRRRAAHEHDPLDPRGHLGIGTQQQRDVGQRRERHQGDRAGRRLQRRGAAARPRARRPGARSSRAGRGRPCRRRRARAARRAAARAAAGRRRARPGVRGARPRRARSGCCARPGRRRRCRRRRSPPAGRAPGCRTASSRARASSMPVSTSRITGMG